MNWRLMLCAIRGHRQASRQVTTSIYSSDVVAISQVHVYCTCCGCLLYVHATQLHCSDTRTPDLNLGLPAPRIA